MSEMSFHFGQRFVLRNDFAIRSKAAYRTGTDTVIRLS